MTKERRTALRDLEIETRWRSAIERWRRSGISQAQFCTQENLNQNTFSSWKTILNERDAEKALEKRSRTVTSPIKTKSMERTEKLPASSAFLELKMSDTDSFAECRQTDGSVQKTHDDMRLTAELINMERGCKLRIFNGADQATLTALLSAWAAS